MKSKTLLACLLLLVLGCQSNDDTVPCLAPAVSSLSYTYTGDMSGTFSVQGEVPAASGSQNIYNSNWALGGSFSEFKSNWILIQANKLYTSKYNGNASLATQLHVPDQGVGKYALPNRGLEFLTIQYDLGWDDQLLFEFVSGEVNVTYHQCDRIMGTFSGELSAVSDGKFYTLKVSNGKFDVKIKPI
jgi:hypothetical protein